VKSYLLFRQTPTGREYRATYQLLYFAVSWAYEFGGDWVIERDGRVIDRS
jgi:hypothetical protein